jgi:hypothetical protein
VTYAVSRRKNLSGIFAIKSKTLPKARGLKKKPILTRQNGFTTAIGFQGNQ